MITSVMNKKMKHIIGLNGRSKLRKTSKEFVVEGKKMFIEAPKDWIREIYVSESFLLKENVEELFADGEFYEIVKDEVFSQISDTVTPQGILVILSWPEYQLSDLIQSENPLLVFLEDLQDPGNLGTIIRTAEGAGVDGVILSKNSVDIFNPKVIRSTMGSIFRVPFLYIEETETLIQEFVRNEYLVAAADLQGATVYDAMDYTKKTMFLIGNEGNGLKPSTSALATNKIFIPMLGEVESLNASVATSLLIYESNRQRRNK